MRPPAAAAMAQDDEGPCPGPAPSSSNSGSGGGPAASGASAAPPPPAVERVTRRGSASGTASSASSSSASSAAASPAHAGSPSGIPGLGGGSGRRLELKSPVGAKSAFYSWPLKKGKGSMRRSEVSPLEELLLLVHLAKPRCRPQTRMTHLET